MKFKEYMNNVTGTYMVFIDEGKTVNINLTNINYIRDYLLETKDKKRYILNETVETIQKANTPNCLKWEKVVFNSEKWYDRRSGYSGINYYYKLVPIIDKVDILLSNPERLLNKLKKACEEN